MIQEGRQYLVRIGGEEFPCCEVQDFFFQPTSPGEYVYLIHFDQALQKKNMQVAHYMGHTRDIERRLKQHRHKRKQDGAAILRSLNKRGIAWDLVKLWRANYHLEHYLKARKQNFARYCPLCQGVPF